MDNGRQVVFNRLALSKLGILYDDLYRGTIVSDPSFHK